MTTTVQCACGRPVQDAVICQECTDKLERALGDVPALVEELVVTRSRQSRTGGQGIGVVVRSHERPLPWDQRAAEAMDVLRSTLVGWVRIVLEEAQPRPRMPRDNLADMARFLLGQVQWLRQHAAADEAVDELAHAVDHAQHVIDRAPDRVYAGPCREEYESDPADPERGAYCCTASLYARAARGLVVCPGCGAEHDVDARREWLLAMAEDQLATATHLSAALSRLGRPLAPATLRKWVERGRIVAHSTNQRGHALYRLGDVLALLVDDDATATRRAGLSRSRAS